MLSLSSEPPALLRHLFTAKDNVSRVCRSRSGVYNNSIAMHHVEASCISRGHGSSPFNPTIAINDHILHCFSALFRPSNLCSSRLFVYFHISD